MKIRAEVIYGKQRRLTDEFKNILAVDYFLQEAKITTDDEVANYMIGEAASRLQYLVRRLDTLAKEIAELHAEETMP